MTITQDGNGAPGERLTNPHGDLLHFTHWGGIRRFDIEELSMLLHPGNEFESGLLNLWVKVGSTAHRLLQPGRSSLQMTDAGRVVRSQIGDIGARIEWVLPGGGDWLVQVELTNRGEDEAEVELLLTIDPALAPYGNVRINEYYVSQYLDLTPVDLGDRGVGVAVRQNMPGARVPWLLVGSLGRAQGWATDALQLTDDVDGRGVLDLATALPNARLQHEHTLVVLGNEPVTLPAGAFVNTGFFGHLETDHPAATTAADARFAETAVARFAPLRPVDTPHRQTELDSPEVSLFDGPMFHSEPLSEHDLDELFGADRDLVETAADTDDEGELWAFRAGDERVTLAAKDLAVLRPHGHMLRTGDSLAPETDVLTSTIWMSGVFASQVTQGHVARGRVISGRRTYLGLLQAHGLRIFVDRGDGPELLGRPSAWALRPDRARWIYQSGDVQLVVTATAPTDRHVLELGLELRRGSLRSAVVASHIALGDDDGQSPVDLDLSVDGATATVSLDERSCTLAFSGGQPRFGSDELLFIDGQSRRQPWLVAVLELPTSFGIEMTADVVAAGERVESAHHLPQLWTDIEHRLGLKAAGSEQAESLDGEVTALASTLAWFAHNAFVHHLSPRGLEQFSGGGWGTRDVSQGPVGLLTALAQHDALRVTLLHLLAAQNERGDWPQAFDFLPPGGYWSQYDSHGDVVFWPLLAVGEYLLTSGDASFLDERVPMVGEQGATAPVSVREHLVAAIDYIEAARVPGSALPAYGHGDWNDSLQPADPALAKSMASTWTAVLQVHSLTQLAAGLTEVDASGVDQVVVRSRELAAQTEADIREQLMADGVLAGYGVFSDAGVELLVHPRDQRTGLTWGVLPWIHAISSDLLTPDEAAEHLALIKQHLWGPDGARLFNTPAAYRGGPMEVFQRAEAATFWGREIGLMYTHAHLRHAEALARFGDAKGLFEALMLVVPQGITDRVDVARPRQSTCYYSSSDGAFSDRYDAAERYGDLIEGRVELEGGWRIYSSGPGLFLRLVVECLLGIRLRGDAIEIDPVLDPRLDGLVAQVPVADGAIEVRYAVSGSGVGVKAVEVDGEVVETEALTNPYRAPGVRVEGAPFRAGAVVTVHVG